MFATEGRIPPLKRLFIKEAGVAIANGLKAVNPGTTHRSQVSTMLDAEPKLSSIRF